RSVRPTLARLGYKIAAEATTSANDTNGGPEDAVAVQRFRAATVDLAILMTSKAGFLQAANAQGYKPTFIDSDYLYGSSGVTASKLNTASLVAALEAVRNRPLLRYSAVSFSPTRHGGVDLGRTLLWRAQCTCYVAQGDLSPLPVR